MICCLLNIHLLFSLCVYREDSRVCYFEGSLFLCRVHCTFLACELIAELAESVVRLVDEIDDFRLLATQIHGFNVLGVNDKSDGLH